MKQAKQKLPSLRCTDARFCYVKSVDTDLHKSFAKIRRKQAEARKLEAEGKVHPIAKRAA